MNAHNVIKEAFGTSHHVLTSYIKDLDQKDLFTCPVEGMNHIALQVGHLIASEYKAIEAIKPGTCPDLPEGFLEVHSLANTKQESQDKFLGVDEYLSLYELQRQATLNLLETFSEEDLDAPGPEAMRDYAPTVGSALLMQALHELMHTGQFVPVRRMAGKPIVI